MRVLPVSGTARAMSSGAAVLLLLFLTGFSAAPTAPANCTNCCPEPPCDSSPLPPLECTLDSGPDSGCTGMRYADAGGHHGPCMLNSASTRSRALGQALEAAGHVRPAGSAAHHIVAGGAKAAAPARAALQRFGIGINDAANGVFLPASRAAPNASGAAVHSTLHTRAYYEAVNDALGQAKTRTEALEVLGALRQGLLGGGL